MPRARRFDGTDDVLITEIGNVNYGGAFTWAGMVRKRRDGVIDVFYSTSGLQLYVGVGADNKVFCSNFITTPTSTTTLTVADGWSLIVITKSSGTTTPRFHVLKGAQGSAWIHENMSTTIVNPAALTLGTHKLRFGSLTAGAFYQSDISQIAWWDAQITSDATVEELSYGRASHRWLDLSPSPDALWEFNQKATSESVTDLTGGGADQLSLVGTTALTDIRDGPKAWVHGLSGGQAPYAPSRARPDTAGWTTRTITADECRPERSELRVDLNDGTDYVIEVENDLIIRRSLWLKGGRNIYIKGMHIDIPHLGYFPEARHATAFNLQDGDTAVARLVYLEGCCIGGEDTSEGLDPGGGMAEVYAVYCRFVGTHPRSADAFGGPSAIGTSGVQPYSWTGWHHSDAVQVLNFGESIHFERCTFASASTSFHTSGNQNDTDPIYLDRCNMRAFRHTTVEEGPYTFNAPTFSVQHNRSDFEGNLDNWGSAGGGATVTLNTSTPLVGTGSMRITQTSNDFETCAARIAFGSQQNWGSATETALRFKCRLNSGGGEFPMARMDLAKTATAGSLSKQPDWVFGEPFKLIAGTTVDVVTNFPAEVISNFRQIRFFLLHDGRGSAAHSVDIDSVDTGTGEPSVTFSAADSFDFTGGWGIYRLESESGPMHLRDVFLQGETDGMWNGAGVDYGRYYDYGVDDYVDDPQVLTDGFADYVYPPPDEVGTDSQGTFMRWDSGVDYLNWEGTQQGKIYRGAPANGDYAAEDVAGVNYVESEIPSPPSPDPEEFLPSPQILRETPPDTAGLYLKEPDGTLVRAVAAGHADHLDGTLALVDYSFTSEREGGFATMDATIVPAGRDRHAIRKLQPASLLLDAGDTLWEGRVETPGEESDSGQLEVSAIGLSVVLAETPVTFLGVSNDLGLWGDPPQARVNDRADADVGVNMQFSFTTGEEGIVITMDSADTGRTVDNKQNGEVWWGRYGQIRVGEVQYIADETQSGSMDPEIQSFDAANAASTSSANLVTTLTKTRFIPTDSSKYVAIRDTPTTGVNRDARTVTIYAASVFGDHELPPQRIEGLPDGLLFSDVLRFLILNEVGMEVTRNGVNTIERSSDPSPNLAWLESTNVRAILDEGMEMEPMFSWQVWEGPTIYYRRRHQGAVWEARRGMGAEFEGEGETASEDYNLAIVVYEDRDGRQRTAGPPGSGCDTEDLLLRNLDQNLPSNQFGIDKPLVIELGLASADKAVEIGQVGLEEATRDHWSGSINLPRFALRNGVWSPTSLLRADDVIFDGDSGRRHPVAAASYTRSNERPLAATIDTPANRLDAALAEFEARPRKVNRKKIRRRARRARHKRQQQRRQARRN